MEEKRISVKGYAKINLHLDITGRMADGYHAVSTVMQTVSLHDELLLTLTEESALSLSCDVSGIPTDGRNLAIRAASLFLEETKISAGARIDLRKRIPMAAGLAGGSADAAAVLAGMNRLCGNPLDTDALCALGARLGADVPFCIVGGTAYADGRGERLRALPAMPDCALVLVCEGEGVSTPWAYGLLDSLYDGFSDSCGYAPESTDALESALRQKDLPAIASSLYNVFEAPILRERPIAASLRSLLIEQGAMGAMMSGSGPSVFGIFEDTERAERAARAIRARGYTPYVCRPTGIAWT